MTEKKQRSRSKASKWLTGILSAIAVIAVIAMVAAPQIVKREGYVPREERNKDYGNYENDDRWTVSETELYGIKCKDIYNPGVKTEIEDHMSYLEFSSKRQAKRVYRLLRKNGYSDISEAGDTYFIGWENGVMDAAIQKMVCLYGRKIVYADVYVASEWARSPDDTSPSSWSYPERRQFMLDHFT